MAIASAHIPDDSDLLIKIHDRAKQRYSGKVSAYVRDLIEKDLSGEPVDGGTDALSPQILEELSRRLCGELIASELATQLAKGSQYPSQAHLLKDLLYGVAEFLHNGGSFNGQDEDETRPRIVNYSSLETAEKVYMRLRRERDAASEQSITTKVNYTSQPPSQSSQRGTSASA